MPWRPWEDVLALVELAAPSACAGCQGPGQRWCARCAAVLAGAPPGPWSPTPAPPGLPPTWSGPAYEGVVRSAVVAWKDDGRADLTRVLAPVLREGLARALESSSPHRAAVVAGRSVVLVPAPSARASTRRRGEHRVRRLLGEAVGRDARPLRLVDALELTRSVADQAGLGAAERQRNLSGAVRARRRRAPLLAGLPCVLVDDVVTTGATLTECARALRAAGSGPVVAVTVAATRRRTGVPGAVRQGTAGPLPVPRSAD